MPDILNQLDFPVRWVHFGDGEMMDIIKSKLNTLPDHVKVELRGHVLNTEVLNFYLNNSVNLVLLLSKTEGGVPVSLQEAVSFGIPVMGTKAGGIPEVVIDGKTGVLLPESPSNIEVATKIKEFNRSQLKYRECVKAVWDKKFNAEKNYPQFIEKILLRYLS